MISEFIGLTPSPSPKERGGASLLPAVSLRAEEQSANLIIFISHPIPLSANTPQERNSFTHILAVIARSNDEAI